MPITMLDTVEFSGIPSLRFVLPVVSADPAAYEAGLIYNSTTKQVKYHNGTSWIVLDISGSPAPPNGNAGGDLAGTYPNPTIASNVIVDADVNIGANIAQVKIANLTTDLAAKLPLSGGTLTGFVTTHADPTADLHVANKRYVDITSQGYSFKSAVRLVTTTNIALSGLAAIDGVTPVANDRILVTGQSTPSQNGIYLAASGAWTRATDMDASGELKDGTMVPAAQGTLNGDSQWICVATGADPWVPNSSTSTWTKFTSLQDLQAGAGLTRSGNVVDVVGDATINVAPDQISVVSAPKWTTGRTLTLSGDVTGATTAFDGTANIALSTTLAGPIAKHFAGSVGAGTAVVVNHALNTRDVTVEVYRSTTPYDTVGCTVERTDANNVTLRFASAVGAGAYRCVVVGR